MNSSIKGKKSHKKSINSIAKTATHLGSSDDEEVCKKCCNCGQKKSIKGAVSKVMSENSLNSSLSDGLAQQKSSSEKDSPKFSLRHFQSNLESSIVHGSMMNYLQNSRIPPMQFSNPQYAFPQSYQQAIPSSYNQPQYNNYYAYQGQQLGPHISHPSQGYPYSSYPAQSNYPRYYPA